ncbi:nucleoside 2-deoxyribosyltransferase [Usitatibacter rugosus]|uniref:nucleoside 2-deoxyribosyltransferase n=1 Tax=Usitatibacter rugosus TaxID=2732067 RepID=UPI001487CD99
MRRNAEIAVIVRAAGMSLFSPQEQLPLDAKVTPVEIVEHNRNGLLACSIVIFVPEGAGAGVYFEVGMAEALGRIVVAFGPPPAPTEGAVPLGHWLRIPPAMRADSLDELGRILRRVRQDSFESADG